jgi:hypothetical protein
LPLARGRRLRRFGGEGSANQVVYEFHKEAEKLEPYVPGDPTGFIHWPAYARTDQLLIKKKRPEVTKRVTVLCRFSDGMHWPDAEFLDALAASSNNSGSIANMKAKPQPKAQIATLLMLDIALRHVYKGDAVMLQVVVEEQTFFVQLKTRAAASFALSVLWPWQGLQQLKAGLEALSASKSSSQLGGGQSDRIYQIKDFLDDWNWQKASAAAQENAPKSEVCIGVTSQLESSREWSSHLPQKCVLTPELLEDKQKHSRQVLQSEVLEEKVSAWIQEQQGEAEERGAAYFLVSEATALSAYADMIGRE